MKSQTYPHMKPSGVEWLGSGLKRWQGREGTLLARLGSEAATCKDCLQVRRKGRRRVTDFKKLPKPARPKRKKEGQS